jgi:hypothetical protein
VRAPRVPESRHRLANLDRGRRQADPAQIRHHQQGGDPQYTLLITDWKTDAPIPEDAYGLHAPAGAKKVEFRACPTSMKFRQGSSKEAKSDQNDIAFP